ncbi:hypothetical protein [Bartonella sp. LJL80]
MAQNNASIRVRDRLKDAINLLPSSPTLPFKTISPLNIIQIDITSGFNATLYIASGTSTLIVPVFSSGKAPPAAPNGWPDISLMMKDCLTKSAFNCG